MKENQPSRTLSVSEESQASSIKTHYFEAETRRLKTYYLTHQNEMIGRRILFNNSCATVRYFGPLINKSETELWVGVEWDEAGRGKHNGTVGDHRYFLC